MLERCCEVLAFLQVTLANLQWPVDEVFFAAQVMDSAGIWFEDDVRVQVVSGISALYMCLKLRANPQEADRGNPLRELAEHASQFLLQNVDEREVQLKEVDQGGDAAADLTELLSPNLHSGDVDRGLLHSNRCDRRERDAFPQVYVRCGQGTMPQPGTPDDAICEGRASLGPVPIGFKSPSPSPTYSFAVILRYWRLRDELGHVPRVSMSLNL